jgi:uncharacterized protein (UPF0333 family)
MRPYRILDERNSMEIILNNKTQELIEITEYTKNGSQYVVHTDQNGIKRFSQKTSTSYVVYGSQYERKMMAHL